MSKLAILLLCFNSFYMLNASPLFDAVKNNNLNDVKNILLASKSTINQVGSNGFTPLYQAVSNNNLEIIDALLKAGADINILHDAIDPTAWLLAGAKGYADAIKLMKNYHVDYSIVNYYGGTALIPAAEKGHVETVKELLKTPIKVDHVNKLGWTALLEVVILGNDSKNHQAIARMLLEAGADPYIKDSKNFDSFHYAKSRNLKQIDQILASYK